MSKYWEDKMHDALIKEVDHVRTQASYTIRKSVEDIVAGWISRGDVAIMDKADEYADGVSQEDLQKAVIEWQCFFEQKVKQDLLDYLKGYGGGH